MLTAQGMGPQARSTLDAVLTHRKMKPQGKLGFLNQYFTPAIRQVVREKPVLPPLYEANRSISVLQM